MPAGRTRSERHSDAARRDTSARYELSRSSAAFDAGTRTPSLVRDLHTWAVSRDAHACLTSFNYDFILESACQSIWAFEKFDLENYVTYGPMSVTKPHGSVLWEQLIHETEGVHAAERAPKAIELMLTTPGLSPIVSVAASPFGGIDYIRPPGVPALALPVDGKSELVWPAEQEQHFASLQHRVSKLLIVGWRAVDQHFIERMERLTRGAKALIVTGGRSADDEALQIQERLLGQVLDNTTTVKFVTTGFSALMNGRELPWLLAD